MSVERLETQWKDAYEAAEMRWMSVEDAEVTLPARLVAEHGRAHEELQRLVIDMAAELRRCGNDHHAFCDLRDGGECDCAVPRVAALLRRVDELDQGE